jgi:hypothetical protein
MSLSSAETPEKYWPKRETTAKFRRPCDKTGRVTAGFVAKSGQAPIVTPESWAAD